MVLSYYIATQTAEEHLKFFYLILFFFLNCGFLIFFPEKQNATHSSSKPRLVERDFYFENVGHGPYYTNTWLIPSTGLVFIYSGEEARRTREQRGRGEWWRGWGFPLVSMEERDLKALVSGISSPTGTTVLGSVDLYRSQCIWEFWGWAGQQWFLCTFSG